MSPSIQPDLSLDLEQCREVVNAYTKRIEELESIQRGKVFGDIKKIVKESNLVLTPEQIHELSLLAGKPVKPGRVAKEGKRVLPKYRSADGRVWSGRGVKPVWVREHIAAGGSVDDFLITKN